MNTKCSLQSQIIGDKFVEFEKRRSSHAPSKNNLMLDLVYGLYYIQQQYITSGNFSGALDNNVFIGILKYIDSKDINSEYPIIKKLVYLNNTRDKNVFKSILDQSCLNGTYTWIVNLSYMPAHLVDGRESLRGPKDENGYYDPNYGTAKGDFISVKKLFGKLLK
jgi:hypothetical protein